MLCPRCGSEATKFGMIPTVKAGKKPRYRCKACGHTFYEGKKENEPT